ncbi:hypothetical protein SISNIDRAFT_355848 [Sistotremastrum niveocremeum HHB9708]|uniref:Uncharacterized protein n=1 Tax=Sistotremastrum niveocremeum HHB9708 TaxID=1314777 RepID=A0A164WHZ9_9AGAM|nr:hypothetical protein SISNIDRAFT_355848 [Sistotremastrum niveocremeum HHB9708]
MTPMAPWILVVVISSPTSFHVLPEIYMIDRLLSRICRSFRDAKPFIRNLLTFLPRILPLGIERASLYPIVWGI